jgi:hypothetical protein
VGVDTATVSVRVLEKVGLPDMGLKRQEAPDGRPEQDKPTDCVEPLVRVTVILLEPELP